MTKEEILESVTMKSILTDRGLIVNRNNMCCCPFHRETNPSMKVYKDGYRCFACGEYGNIFDFIMRYEGVDFKTAYISLGGTYKAQTDKERRLAEKQRERARFERERQEKKEANFKNTLKNTITLVRNACECFESTSEEWCYFENKLPQLLYIWQIRYEEGKEVDEIDVLRICREIRQKLNTFTRVDGRAV